jgi:hypothetical protein
MRKELLRAAQTMYEIEYNNKMFYRNGQFNSCQQRQPKIYFTLFRKLRANI